MDQSAFRALLASGTSSASTHRDGGGALGAGSRKRHFGGGPSNTKDDYSRGGIPNASSTSFKPRNQHKSKPFDRDSKGKQKDGIDSKDKDVDHEKEEEASYRRYGYADGASARRAGAQGAGTELEKLLAELGGGGHGGLRQAKEEEPPAKTEEEIEKELEEAEKALKSAEDAKNRVKEAEKDDIQEEASPAKKQKRSRADMLRDLQAKIAASSSARGNSAPSTAVEDSGTKSSNGKTDSGPAIKGFKVIERAPEKKLKKKKKKALAEDGKQVLAANPENLASGLDGVKTAPMDTSTAAGVALKPDNGAIDIEDDDIFAGAGDYEDEFGSEDEEGEQKETRRKEDDSRVVEPYFEDQDTLIPKFRTYKSPTPPSREEIERMRLLQEQERAGQDGESAPRPVRLEGLSTSTYTAKDLLAYDDAQAREEKRKLRKLKGKERKEALAREQELHGSKNAEAKEKDRLNREIQEFEKYERRKQGRNEQTEPR